MLQTNFPGYKTIWGGTKYIYGALSLNARAKVHVPTLRKRMSWSWGLRYHVKVLMLIPLGTFPGKNFLMTSRGIVQLSRPIRFRHWKKLQRGWNFLEWVELKLQPMKSICSTSVNFPEKIILFLITVRFVSHQNLFPVA